jgi:hypothetical protein
MVSSPQRLDWVLSIVVWCGVLPHHQSIDKKPAQVGFLSIELGWTSGRVSETAGGSDAAFQCAGPSLVLLPSL